MYKNELEIIMFITCVFPEEAVQDEEFVQYDSQRMTILLRCLSNDCTLETFQGMILYQPIPDERGLTLREYNTVAEFFGIERIEIINGILIIPVASVTANTYCKIRITYDDELFADPELIMIDPTPEMDHMRCARVILPHELPMPIPSFVKVYGMKNNVITDYDDNTDYDYLVIDTVSAYLQLPVLPVPYISLRKPYENQDEKQFEVIDSYTVTDRGAAYLKESDIIFGFPLRFAIKRNDEMILSASFDTPSEVLKLLTLRVLYGLPTPELIVRDDGRYRLSLGIFFLNYRFFSFNSTLEFINGDGHPFEICLVSNPSKLLNFRSFYIDLYVDNDVLIIKNSIPSDSDGDPVYISEQLTSGTKITHFYTDVSYVGIKANMVAALNDETIFNIILHDEDGEPIWIDDIQLQQVGDCLIPPAEAKYLIADHRYVKSLFCEK